MAMGMQKGQGQVNEMARVGVLCVCQHEAGGWDLG